MANPKTILELLGYLKGGGSKLDRLRAMAKARRRFSMVAPGKTGGPKVLGHREDVLAPSLSDALRERSNYRYEWGQQPRQSPEATWLRKRGTSPPWWNVPVEKGDIEPLGLDHLLQGLSGEYGGPTKGVYSWEDLTEQTARAATLGAEQDAAADWVIKNRRLQVDDKHLSEGQYSQVTDIGKSLYPTGSPVYRHETLHGLLSTMTPEEAKTMPLPFRVAHWAKVNDRSSFPFAWQPRFANEVQAWAGQHRGDASKGLRELLLVDKHAPPDKYLRHPSALAEYYLRDEYRQPETADLYSKFTTDHPDSIDFREELKSRAGMGAAAAGAAGYSLYQLRED